MTDIRTASLAAVILLAACLPDDDRTVTSADFGDAWPFTVESGKVNCFKNGYTLTFAPDARMSYALNGTAKADGYPAVDPIWRDNENIPGTKINLQPLIEAAQAVCR